MKHEPYRIAEFVYAGWTKLLLLIMELLRCCLLDCTLSYPLATSLCNMQKEAFQTRYITFLDNTGLCICTYICAYVKPSYFLYCQRMLATVKQVK